MVEMRPQVKVEKPQEEPKEVCARCGMKEARHNRDDIHNHKYIPYPEKETEPKEGPVIEMMNYKIDGHIVLQRPKGKSIGAAIMAFETYCEEQYDSHSSDDYRITDEEFLARWSQFIKSQE